MKLRISILFIFISHILFSQSFHDTQGKLEISNSGQATFTLPIAMPPSIMDVGPIINLQYSSGQNGGIVGQGWNIAGISYIARMSTRQDIDGFRDGVDFDESDKLSIDGQRLILKSGDYWADGSIYQTEVQSNTKIELKGSGNSIYFIVTTPDGSRTWYGNYNSANTTDATAYYVTRFEDMNGNFMTYHYSKPPGKSLLLTEIKFSANTITNPTPLNKIVFSYEMAARKENGYINGQKSEKGELLNYIEVFTNNLLFKKYEVTHSTDENGYQRVSKIEESNGAGEKANPILFEYKTTLNDVTEVTAPYTDDFNFATAPTLSGDFDGDGRMDFYAGSKIYTKLFENSNVVYNFTNPNLFGGKFTATTVYNGKINQSQSIVNATSNLTSVHFSFYNIINNAVINTGGKSIALDNAVTCIDNCPSNEGPCYMIDDDGTQIIVPCNKNCPSPPAIKSSNRFLEGDFNGDSISDVLVFSYQETRTYGPSPLTVPGEARGEAPQIPCAWTYNTATTFSGLRLVDLNPNVSSAENEPGNVNLSGYTNLLQGRKHYVMDFNSDGKSDILAINDQKHYYVLSFKQLTVAPWCVIEVLSEGSFEHYSKDKQLVFGDFNADGKPDVMMPDADGIGCSGCDLWHIYYSNANPVGDAYFTKQSLHIVEYKPDTSGEYETQRYYNGYYAIDINKDGKSDLIKVKTGLYKPNPNADFKDYDSMWKISAYINNIGFGNSGFNLYYDSSEHTSEDNSLPITITSNYRYKGLDNDLLVLRSHGNNSFNKITTFVKFQKDFNEDNLLNKVNQSGGSIMDEITYANMESSSNNNGLGLTSETYSSGEELLYPFIELKRITTNKLVSQIRNTSLGILKKQDFKYHGLSIGLNGLGTIGFKKTARSSWYSGKNDYRTWNVSENNPLKRGATVKTYSLLLNSSNFAFSNNYSTELISKTENTYTESPPNTFPYSILVNEQKSTDFITGKVSQKIYNSYSPDYLLPLSITSNNYLGTVLHGSTATITDYDNVVSGTGSGYYIGRPKEVTTTSTVFVNTAGVNFNSKTSTEKFNYTDGNLTQTEQSANASPEKLVEEFEYFQNGLLKKKTASVTGTNAVTQVDPRSTSYTYDPTNRFVSTTTDVENMVTQNLTFHPLYGVVLTQKNAYDQSTTSVYDNWGKRTKVTDFLGKSINYSYSRYNGIYKTIQTGDDGSSSFVDSDALARQVKKGARDFNGNWVHSDTEYDYLGKKTRESEPYLASGYPSQWTTFEYDEYSRPIKTTAYTGKIVTNSYSGMTATANDGIITKSKTMNANGQVIIATDITGNTTGTINYKYDANNNLTVSNYDGVEITMTYDDWGRKKQIVDTSAGTYDYTYNGFGETLTESTPKGKTTYTLNPVGKVLTKTIVGTTNVSGGTNDEHTNITSTYSYDATNKWLTNLAVQNTYDGNSNYAYSYDATTKQLNKTIETLPFATFTKELTFDAFGRVSTELSKAESHGKISSKTIRHNYQYGVDIELIDNATNQSLYRTNTVNARGQFTTGYFGNGINLKKEYDPYGFLTNSQFYTATDEVHEENGELVITTTNTDVMVLTNQFEPIRGNLLYRSNSLFAWDQTLEYDSLDRLKKWTSTPTELFNYNFSGSSTQGFTGVNGGTVVTFLSRLRINTTLAQAGAQKLVENNSYTGNKYKIQVKVIKNTVDKIRVVAVEENNATGAFTYTVLGLANEGLFQSDYVVQNADAKLYIRFDKSENSTDVGVSKFFWIDDLVVSKYGVEAQTYDDRGKITENSLGQYQYTNTQKPYQNTSVTTSAQANAYYQTKALQEITYTAFKAPIEIVEPNIDRLTFGYNAMEQRNIMYYGSTATNKMERPYRKYYSADGSMEIKATFAPGNTATPTSVEFITYIGGDAYSAPVVVKSNGTTQNYFFLQRDYQGSIVAITDANANIVEKRLFDVWGEVLKVQDGANNNLTKLTFFDRGYTGHEHLQSVGLINMNARLYDPKLHRFLSPDNFVQDPYNTQNYNRYGYCVNNPTKYTDITGNVFGIDDAIIIGAGIALATYLATNFYYGMPITLKGAFVATFIGAVSGAVTFGIGTYAESIGNFYTRAAFQALSHGTFQGTMSGIQGGSFWTGFASGALASIASTVWQGGNSTSTSFEANSNLTGGHFVTTTVSHAGIGGATGAVGTILFGSVMGGAGSALTGGNFWQGAVTGLVVSGLNHAAHDMMDDGDGPKPKPKAATKASVSDFKSGSAIVGYEGMVLNKAEIGIKLAGKGQSITNLRHISKTLKYTSRFGKVLGVGGIGLSVYEDYKSGGVTWGTAVKVGVGGALLFASAPVALTYAALDIGWGLATGTTLTDTAANYVNKKMK